MKLLKEAEYMAATGFTFHPTIAFRSGLGPYKPQVTISVTSNPTAEWIAGQVTCLPVGRSSAPPDSRPRRSLWSSLYSSHSRNGDQRSPYGATLAVAERAR